MQSLSEARKLRLNTEKIILYTTKYHDIFIMKKNLRMIMKLKMIMKMIMNLNMNLNLNLNLNLNCYE